ncbi:hypothetical protein ACROYT_G025900 [Oculina patagonica]
MCKALTGVLSQPELLKDIDLPPFGEHTARCKWECIIPRRFESTDSARAATKASFDKYRIVSLDLTLSKHVSSECLNETDSYRLSEPADAWMWLTLNTRLTHDRTIFARLNKSFQGQMKGRVVCTLSKDIFNTATAQLYSINDMIAEALMAELEVQYHPELAWQSGAVLCYKEKGQSLYVCLTYHKPLDATLFYSCPMSTIIDLFVQEHIRNAKNRHEKCFRITYLTVLFILPCAAGESFFLLTLASLFIKTLTKMLSPENIPHVTLAVLSVFYCSRRYNSLKRKYDDLAAMLHSHLKKRVKVDGTIDNQHGAPNLEYNKKKAIPKSLFDNACQEIMPLGENVEKLVLSIFIILFLSFLVFMIIMKTPGVPDRMKITTMFLVAVMPMIVEIVVLKKGDKTKELEQEELDEKIQSIVDGFRPYPPPGGKELRDKIVDGYYIGERHGIPTEANPSDHGSDSPDSIALSEFNIRV